MRTLLVLLLTSLLASTPSGGIAADEDDGGGSQAAAPKVTAAEAEARAQAWLDGLGDAGLVLEEASAEEALQGRRVPGMDATSFDFRAEGWWLTVGFSGTVDDGTSLGELRQRLTYVALDTLPTPGLEVPGWEIKPRTPTSRIEKGIEVVSLEDGVITLRIKTRCFALYGTDPQAMSLVPADAGAPKSAYFQIRRDFPLELTLTAELRMPDE